MPTQDHTVIPWSLCVLTDSRAVVSPLQPTLTLQNSLLTRFPETGLVSVTVQASNGRSMVQDTRTVRVYGNTVAPLWCFAAADAGSASLRAC